MSRIWILPIALLLTASAGCDEIIDDTVSTDSDTDTDSDTSAATGCSSLCAQAESAGVADGACVSQELQSLGYDVVGAPRECAAIAGNEAGCLACMTHLEVTDPDCATVETTCL